MLIESTPLANAAHPSTFAMKELAPLPFKTQLLKWIGNKQKQAPEIIRYFPKNYGTYYEPFLGSGGVLGVLAPERAVASDVFKPLVEIWATLHANPKKLKSWYATRHA